MKGNERNGYTFMRQWFDFAYQHPDKITPTHAALYFWLIQLNNSLDWKLKFGVPTVHTMEVLGIKSYKTYRKAFDELKGWGFIELVTKSTNQHTANVIALVKFTQADTKASPKQLPKQDDIVKPLQTDKPFETLKTPNEGLPEKILNLFIDAHGSYIILTPQQRETELAAAQTLIDALEKTTPGLNEAEILKHFREYFVNKCINTPDEFIRKQISLPTIVKYFNRINSAAVTSKGGTFVSDRSGKYSDSDWGRIPRAGTSPDLSKVDNSNLLNED